MDDAVAGTGNVPRGGCAAWVAVSRFNVSLTGGKGGSEEEEEPRRGEEGSR